MSFYVAVCVGVSTDSLYWVANDHYPTPRGVGYSALGSVACSTTLSTRARRRIGLRMTDTLAALKVTRNTFLETCRARNNEITGHAAKTNLTERTSIPALWYAWAASGRSGAVGSETRVAAQSGWDPLQWKMASLSDKTSYLDPANRA